MRSRMDTLRYFEYTHDSGAKQIILYNPNHITTYQARSAACFHMCFWEDDTAGGEILRISDPEKFYHVFRSVLPYLEKCEPLDGAAFGNRAPEDMERLKQICDELDAKKTEQERQAEQVEGEVFLRFIREPRQEYATAFDLRDIKDMHQAQLGSERYGWLDLSREQERALHDAICPLRKLTCYEKVLAGSDLPWLKEEKNFETVVKEREQENGIR